jgi:hypothetical protein
MTSTKDSFFFPNGATYSYSYSKPNMGLFGLQPRMGGVWFLELLPPIFVALSCPDFYIFDLLADLFR